MTFRRKQQYSYFRLTIIMTAVIGLSVYVFARIWQNAFWYGRILGHKIQTACGCTELSELIIMHPIIFGSVLALGVLAGTAALLAAVKFYTIWSQTRKFCRLYLNSAKANHSAKLKKTLKRMKFDKQRVAETACDDPVVFCYGWWKPKICVSSGLVAILHPAELETVLRHEEQHVISREPAKLFMFKYFYHLYFFLPGLKTLIKQYETFSEMAADEWAVNMVGNKKNLARAVWKLSETVENRNVNLSLSFFTSIVAERVNKFADNGYMPRFRIWGRGFALGAGSVVVIMLLVGAFIMDSDRALAMHNFGGCSIEAGPADGRTACASNMADHQSTSTCRQ